MATAFQIKKGLSSQLFNSDGSCKLSKLIENCWYLTTDTAEVYVALRSTSTDILELKKLNEVNIDSDIDLDSFEERISALENEEKVHTFGYRTLFPLSGENGHMYIAVDEHKSYVWYDNQYIILSSDYEEPDIIFGGTAD